MTDKRIEELAARREEIGRLMHESWCETQRAQGFHGPTEPCTYADDPCCESYCGGSRLQWVHCLKFHADLVPWEQLPEGQKDINRHAFDDILPLIEGWLVEARLHEHLKVCASCHNHLEAPLGWPPCERKAALQDAITIEAKNIRSLDDHGDALAIRDRDNRAEGARKQQELFCKSMDIWAQACTTPLETDDKYTRKWRDDFRQNWAFIRMAIVKSCLLDRLIYGGETLRAEQCPEHKGRWSGCSSEPCPACNHGICTTGWKKNPGDPESPNTGIAILVCGRETTMTEEKSPLRDAALIEECANLAKKYSAEQRRDIYHAEPYISKDDLMGFIEGRFEKELVARIYALKPDAQRAMEQHVAERIKPLQDRVDVLEESTLALAECGREHAKRADELCEPMACGHPKACLTERGCEWCLYAEVMERRERATCERTKPLVEALEKALEEAGWPVPKTIILGRVIPAWVIKAWDAIAAARGQKE